MTRVAIYARQSVREDELIELQVQQCRAEAERRRWAVADVYADNATSASKDRGPTSQWSRMLADIDAGRIDTVLVVAPDRLTRRVVDILEVTAPKRAVRLVSVRGGLDTDDSFGQFTLTLLTALAEQEIRTKEARNVPVRAARREAGHPSAGRTPFGYEWVTRADRDEAGTRYRVTDHADLVRFAFAELLGGVPLGSIARELNERGSTTIAGKSWTKTTVRRMLLNPAYAALLVPRTEGRYHVESIDIEQCTPGAWPAIVDRDTVLAARAILLDPSRRAHDAGTARKHLLSGLAVCDVCDEPVRSAVSREGFPAYRCPAGHFHRRSSALDALVGELVVGRLSRPDATSLVQPTPGVDVAALNARRTALTATRSSLLDLLVRGTFTEAEVEARATTIDAELASINSTLADARARDPLADLVDVEDVRAVWDGLTLARRRLVVAALFTLRIRSVGKGVRTGHLDMTIEDDVEAMLRTVVVDWSGTTTA